MTDPRHFIPPSTLRVNGVDVAYRRKGAGTPIVYFHGMGLTRRWLPLHELLAADADLTVPEHPGFGDTPRPRWFRSLDDMVLHHADFLDALELPSFHLVGHSLGGLIAGSFAAIFPERVRSLTLIAPAPLPGADEEDELPPDDVDPDALLFNGNQAAYPDFLDAGDEGLRLAEEDERDAPAPPGAWDDRGAPALRQRLARVRMPSQVLAPDEDLIVPEAGFPVWAAALGGAPVVRIPGRVHPTGHLLVVQEPEQIAAAVARQLDAAA
jgi:pimeloyl-ACP methyl ester carboxylesterase